MTAPDRSLKLHKLTLQLIVVVVALHGMVLIGSTLDDQLHISLSWHLIKISGFVFGVPILAGMSLLYLSFLLWRRKHTAWLVTVALYAFIGLFSIVQLLLLGETHPVAYGVVARNLLLPLLIVLSLLAFRQEFNVRSDMQTFKHAVRFSVLALLVAFIYGVSGFMLLDNRDFHHSTTLAEAMHHTVDQFDLTTPRSLHPYTKRAQIFMDSLAVVSVGAVAYAAVSLFQPIKARFTDQKHQRELAQDLLGRYRGNSEDYFKLWPHDKLYFFNLTHNAGLAYAVRKGVALVVGDPFGDKAEFDKLLDSFEEFCYTNDWLPAFIHTEPEYNELYKRHDLNLQKIGEEAVLDIAQYEQQIKGNKYFRQIRNKFAKQGYNSEILVPPHNSGVLASLQAVTNDWLSQPGREERTFMMGYYSDAYMQQCKVLVARDKDGVIQGFVNLVQSFDPDEANYDLLRQTHASLGNCNDYLLMELIEYVKTQGFKRINLGLCPLSGLDSHDEERSVTNSALRFLYANGDRFYSFSGLRRFKTKYRPEWSSRYIAYRGGIRSFTRILNALNKALKI